MSAECSGFAELRSAYVDGALEDRDRERLLRHLTGCPDCRREVIELQEVRRLLGGAEASVATPVDLSLRLVSIAGTDSTSPLHVRSFRRAQRPDGHFGLPRRSRIQRARLTAASLTVGAAVAAAGVVGYAAAPPPAMARIDDPSSEAQTAFSSTLGEFPLTSDSLGAMMGADATTLVGTTPSAGLGPVMDRGVAIDPVDARAAMVRAGRADDRVSYTGLQSFTIVRNGVTMAADLEIEARAGQEGQVRLMSRSGQSRSVRFAAKAASETDVHAQLLDLLTSNYTLTGARGAVVARRPATVIAAFHDGAVAARWWVDDATGILLWQESYDDNGMVDLSYGFTAVAITRNPGIFEHLQGRLGVSSTTTSLSLPDAARLATAGWSCPRDLSGLSLVRIRSDRLSDPDTLHLVYSDGVATVTVFEQRGRLPESPEGLAWDAGLGVYVRHAATEVASWQSGDRVYTVVTDGSEELLTAAVRLLPHEASRTPTTVDRILAGWSKIAADVKG